MLVSGCRLECSKRNASEVGGVSRETIETAITAMKVFITGFCGITGLYDKSLGLDPTVELYGIDNLVRTDSEQNRRGLKAFAVTNQ